MGKEGRRLKRCSTSTDVEPTDDHHKRLHGAEKELQTDVNPKKRKKKSKSKQIDEDDLEPPKKKKTSDKKEMKKLRKSFKEMTETMKNLQEFFLGRADLPGPSLTELLLTTAPDTCSSKEEEEPLEKTEEEPLEKTEELTRAYECCFETEDSDGFDRNSVIVKGLDTSLSRDFLKSELRKYFESCGCEVTRVFVPIECETGVPLGYAFIDVDDEINAMFGGNGYMGGCKLFITMANTQRESVSDPDFKGCGRCGTILAERRHKRFITRPPWRRY